MTLQDTDTVLNTQKVLFKKDQLVYRLHFFLQSSMNLLQLKNVLKTVNVRFSRGIEESYLVLKSMPTHIQTAA